ncbi:class I SAM-dependent methyltransferase [uncultured Pseudokineococcus sp.]|uniref:class I SAM-dependent methyltransferase n=1 Tax=uncultured Pseudokineococcus sp. TaxID=1642928 RepID=UPI002628FDF7|nr:class I SAM-dependent methyltransferase [uncultured Pseudokineococcus sp.]
MQDLDDDARPPSAPPAGEVPLPPLELRTGGAHFTDDQDYRRLAARDVRGLQERAGLGAASRLLDWGCGAGRLAVGLRATGAEFGSYLGVDVQADHVAWAQANLATDRISFVRVDDPNARYNPGGTAVRDLPAEDASVDVLHAYSVFSHMTADDTARYLEGVCRVLAPAGRAVVTAFVERGVPSWSVNPPGYGPLAWEGPLHCVRYDEDFFADLVAASGLAVVDLSRGGETDGQSLLVLERARRAAGDPPAA